MTIKRSLSFFTLALLGLGCLDGKEVMSFDVMDRPDLWPFRVALKEDLSVPENNVLTQGRIGVLIRVEEMDDGRVVACCDFGRNGIYQVSVESTDLVARMEEIAAKPELKRRSNYVEMLANKFRMPDGAGDFAALPLPAFKEKGGFIFIYINRTESYKSLAKRLKNARPIIEERAVIPILLPLFPYVDSDLTSSVDNLDMDVGIFPAFLCHPFIRALHHEAKSENMLVVTDMDGLILYRNAGLDFEAALSGAWINY